MSTHQIRELVFGELSDIERQGCLVYLDTRLREPGEKVGIGLSEMDMPFLGYRVFVDLMPGANWGHRCAYFLVSTESGKFVRIENEFPPFSGDVPEEFEVL